MECGRAIQHAQEVCRGRRFSIDKDIRQPVFPFVHLLSVCHHISLTVLRSSLALSKSFVIAHDLIILSCFLISFVYRRCSYQ